MARSLDGEGMSLTRLLLSNRIKAGATRVLKVAAMVTGGSVADDERMRLTDLSDEEDERGRSNEQL